MLTSLLLAGFVLGIFLLGAWAVDHYGRRYSPPRKARRKALIMALAGVLLAGYAFYSDYGLRRTTLFEVMAAGSEGIAVGAPAPVREYSFRVEHPGVEHELMVAPNPRSGRSAHGAVELHIVLESAAGETLIDTHHLFERHLRRNRYRWAPLHARFVPTVAGMHWLSLTLLTVDIPEVHIRVADPEKTDGRRIPGY